MSDNLMINATALAEQIVYQITNAPRDWREIERMANALAGLTHQICTSAPETTSQP
jgi:hypothetical protein